MDLESHLFVVDNLEELGFGLFAAAALEFGTRKTFRTTVLAPWASWEALVKGLA